MKLIGLQVLSKHPAIKLRWVAGMVTAYMKALRCHISHDGPMGRGPGCQFHNNDPGREEMLDNLFANNSNGLPIPVENGSDANAALGPSMPTGTRDSATAEVTTISTRRVMVALCLLEIL